MAQNTNLNVTPYYDDFDKTKNFYRVLFRPGFPIQARELTTMQSIMQNQVENVGSHLFKDGAMVIPGQIGYDLNVDAIQLQESFLGADVENYRSQLNGKIIEGLTSGVKAKVLFSISASDSSKGYITLYVKYIESGGTGNTQSTFSNNEQVITDTEITFGTTLIEVGSPFAQLLPTAALQQGSVAYIQDGVYFIRGFFVDVQYQYLLLDQYGSNPSYRIGLDIQESIITPEDDLSLNDNAAGTSNYAAPGSHRFRITTRLVKKLLTDDADKDFLELLRINNSKVEKLVDRSAYDELERSLATRTFEESGDYVVRDFALTTRENLDDGFNNGVYEAGSTTAQGNTAAENMYAMEFGPGTAYVRGYRIKTLSPTYVDVMKPRDTQSIQNNNIPFEMGNDVVVSNVFGFPNATGGTISNAYQTIELRDTFSSSQGSQAGNIIGFARLANMEHTTDGDNTTFGDADDTYRMNIFDVQMFTAIEFASAQTIDAGSLLIGASSGARGYLVDALSSADHTLVYGVEGTFQTGEMITVDGLNKDTIEVVHTFDFGDTRQVLSRDENTNNVEYTADIVLNDTVIVQGVTFTYDAASGNEKITGNQSNFALDLRPGDRIFFSPTKFVDVDKVNPASLTGSQNSTIFDYGAQTVNVTPGAGSAAPSAGDYTGLLRQRVKLNNILNSDLLSAMPKKYIKSISDESMKVRRTFDARSVASNSVSITLPANEQFEAINDANYTITVLAGSNSTHPVGDQVTINTTNSSAVGYTTRATGLSTLNIENLTNITSIKVTATISKNVTTKKTKAGQQMFVLKVNKTIENLDKQNFGLLYSNLYGTRVQDRDISLGLVDAYRLHAVYESLDDNDPIIPSVTLVEPTFFATGSIVTGRTSKARAKVVAFSSGTLKLSLVYVSGKLQSGETIDGFDTAGTALTAIINDSAGSVIDGSKVITDNYFLEVAQTNFMYDQSRIVRKKGASTPIRKILMIVDYYTHSATGDYFGGQSYLNTAYGDIPFFGTKFLADYLDFRPGCKNLYSGTGTVASPAFVNCSTFDFKSRVFNVSGTPNATIFDVPKIDSNFKADFDWYLPRTDKAFLTPAGEFQIIKGKSSEQPQEPDDLKDGMLLATINHKPYGFDAESDVVITRSDNKRYTMRDIGGIERRLDQVEYYTSLNMLESDTFNTKIIDADGKDRLKNGFIVDDFSDHSKSQTSHEDFSAALDFAGGTCHPSHYTTNIPLQLNTTVSQNYTKTGPCITLPYTELTIIEQPYASRVENINPFNVFTYIGRVDLTPASDDWIETQRLPAQVQNIEGNFAAVASELRVDQNGFAPVQWNAWRDQWTTSRVISSTEVRNTEWLEEDVGRSPRPDVWDGRGMRRVNREEVLETVTRQRRTGIRSRVIPRIDRQSLGDSIISSTAIPWIRSRNIKVNVERLKPRTRFYAFFDGRKVSDYMTPKLIELIKDPSTDARTNSTPFIPGETVRGEISGCVLKVAAPNDLYVFNPYDDTSMPSSYASTTAFLNINTDDLAAQAVGEFFGNVQVGEVLVADSGARAVVKDRRLISDRFGKMGASFFIPTAAVNTNPRWATGTRVIRFSTSDTNSRIGGAVESSAEAEYEARGTLNRVRENILSVRNADIVRDTVTQERNFNTLRTETRQIGWYDPLAQSFISDEEGGVFLTSVEVYFKTRDANIPVSMQVRTMENGYPTTNILPFSDVTLEPSVIQLSETGAVATKFTFKAPVYIPQSIEHCFVLLSDSNEYTIWISRMGEIDISGDRTISEQPYAGVLFKSQNASTWTADQYEDLKFKVNRAEFDTSVLSTVTLNNAPLDIGNGGKLNLQNDPILTFPPSVQIVTNTTTAPFTVGARIYQKGSLAQGTITKVTPDAGGDLLTVNDITGVFQGGSVSGSNVVGRIVSSKTTATMVVSGASGAFTVGETITGNSATSPTAEVVTWVSGTNTLTLRYVSTEFTPSSETVTGGTSNTTATVSSITYAGDAVEAGAISDIVSTTQPTFQPSEKKIRVAHSNHCMHSPSNNVVITGVESEVSPTYLTAAISATDTTFNVNDASAFHQIINGAAISSTNKGYARVISNAGTEIVSYTAISSDFKTMTVAERGLDGTTAVSHVDESVVECYNLDGIPLIEINKTHTTLSNPTLDTYELATSSIARLGIKSGGANAVATQNVQYDILVPQIERMLLPQTNVTARVNIISGSSINNGAQINQESFANDGVFSDIILSEDNPLLAPGLICSTINESSELSGAKSFRLDLSLTSNRSNVSPVLDTDRMSMTTVMNRINNPDDPNTAKLSTGDSHDAVYITRAADLSNPSGAIKVLFAGYRPDESFIKVLYRVRPTGSTDSIETFGFEFFPDNQAVIPAPTQQIVLKDYEYEVSGLNFDQYQIKIVFVSPNQSATPIIEDFRAIALAI